MKTFWKIVLGSLIGCLVAGLICLFVMFGMIGSLSASVMSGGATAVSGSVLRIDGSTAIVERVVEDMSPKALMNRSKGGKLALLDAVRAIDAAAADPAIKLICIEPDEMSGISLANVEELRAALSRFRASGKPVVAYSGGFSTVSYYLASVADKVILNTEGSNMILGVASQSIYLKELFDKLGVEYQLIRHGKYKSAGEMYIRSEMSDENRLQMQSMVDGLWGSLADEICASRDFSRAELDGWVANLELDDAQSLLDRKLVDTIWYADQFKDYLTDLDQAKDYDHVKFVDLVDYAPAHLMQTTRAKDKVAVLYANGEIVMSGDAEQSIVGDEFAAQVAKVRADSTIKAVVFRVNSPGGSVQASQYVRREIELLRATKPVIASYGSYAASGGYWISSSCDKIFCDNTTLTGSIGVFSLIPNLGDAARKTLKVNIQTIGSHPHSDMMSAMRSLDGAELDYMQKSVEEIYDEFLSIVSAGRDLPKEKVDEIAQGRVWCGCDAFGIGLADEKGGLVDAIAYAASAAGLQDYRLEEYPAQKSTMERFLEAFGGSVGIKTLLSPAGESLSGWERTQEQFLQAYSFLKNQDEPAVYARMPFITEIK